MEYRESEHVKVRNPETDIERAYNVLDNYVFDVGITGKNEMRFRLLTEEVIRLVRQIMGGNIVELWFEGSKKLSHIVLEFDADLDEAKKEELGSVASSGRVTEEKGFFGKLADMFLMETPRHKTWSLKEYQKELKARKDVDNLSQEAWEDLERSLVANLADDIEITINKKHVKMITTKDFSETLSYVSRNALAATSRQIVVGSEKDAKEALDKAEEIISELSLTHKDELHAKLVFEETIGMLQKMTGDYNAVIWLEKYSKSFCLKLTAQTEMDYDKKNDLLAMSTENKNESVRGFMDKLGDIVQNSLLNYEHVVSLSQQYGGDVINYGAMGMYGSMETMAEYGVMWSLDEYRGSLSDVRETEDAAQEAWDELEKSIVANLASDVLVGVKGNRVDMTIICKLSKQ